MFMEVILRCIHEFMDVTLMLLDPFPCWHLPAIFLTLDYSVRGYREIMMHILH